MPELRHQSVALSTPVQTNVGELVDAGQNRTDSRISAVLSGFLWSTLDHQV